MLPLLVVLFLISYGLMTLLIVEQGHTILSQRSTIQLLLSDSSELTALKGKAIREQALSSQAQRKAQVQPPSTQAVPIVPSEKDKAGTRHNGKAQRPAPTRPPKPSSDLVDVRRNLHSI